MLKVGLIVGSTRPNRFADIPVSQWDQDDDFDGATACDESRAQRIDLANTLAARLQERLESLERKLDSLSDEQAKRLAPELNRRLDQAKPNLDKTANFLAGMRASKCISSDDPHLKGN